MSPSRQPCRGCGADVLHIEDMDTREPIVIDATPVDGGHISVYVAGGHAVARRYGQPARVQPAWREHVCPTPTVAVPTAVPTAVPVAVPVDDPYEDEPAAVQQHGGWRA